MTTFSHSLSAFTFDHINVLVNLPPLAPLHLCCALGGEVHIFILMNRCLVHLLMRTPLPAQ
jgi:hypothetical protein